MECDLDLTRTKCKRIVRIERLAEGIIQQRFAPISTSRSSDTAASEKHHFVKTVMEDFDKAIASACADPEVVGFKSVICYRTGLAVPTWEETKAEIQSDVFSHALVEVARKKRLEHRLLSPAFLHRAVQNILASKSSMGQPKPLQFHTGLGDNDITLRLSSPSHLQPFIKAYPKLPIVLLHASYPFTREAGYLASVYENVYLDVGEVFPFVSQDGQEKVIAQALELCPSEKLHWSTDGHWFPETYLLAVVQVREALEHVLGNYVSRGALDASQACRIVQDLFFNTSNSLYKLNLNLSPLPPPPTSVKSSSPITTTIPSSWPENLALLTTFLASNPDITYLRLQWLDYTSTLRVRILPLSHALSNLHQEKFIGIITGVFGLLQNDFPTEGCGSTVGDYKLVPCFDSLRRGPKHDFASYATVQCEFRELDGREVPVCPRTRLRQVVQRAKAERDVDFLVGFETEVVFMKYSDPTGVAGYTKFGVGTVSQGHSWSSSRALDHPKMMKCLETIAAGLRDAGITLEQFQTEAAPGQYEFVTGPLPALAAVDALIATRETIQRVAAEFDMRATFHPKPMLDQIGTGQHVHLSMTVHGKEDPIYMSFYAGILKHLRALCSFTYPLPESYTRVASGLWAGGRHVAWGNFNRETPLRRIDGSHWELRFVDGFANSYLALGAILAAGLQGILDGEEMRCGSCGGDPSAMREEERKALGIEQLLPQSVEEGWRALDEDPELREAVGGEMVDYLVRVQRHELELLDGMDKERRRHWLIERY